MPSELSSGLLRSLRRRLTAWQLVLSCACISSASVARKASAQAVPFSIDLVLTEVGAALVGVQRPQVVQPLPRLVHLPSPSTVKMLSPPRTLVGLPGQVDIAGGTYSPKDTS